MILFSFTEKVTDFNKRDEASYAIIGVFITLTVVNQVIMVVDKSIDMYRFCKKKCTDCRRDNTSLE